MDYVNIAQLGEEASQSLHEVMNALNRTHRLFNEGLLLEVDLDSVVNDLQSSAQSGLDKVDDAVKSVKNFQAAFRNVGKEGNVFALLLVGANKTLEDLNKLANLDLGFGGGFSAFFSSGGKYAAAIDALETHMKLFDRFSKTIGSFMAQLARSMRTIPESVREKYNIPDATIKDMLDDPEVKKKLNEKMLKKALKAAIKHTEEAAGDAGFSIKGIKNMFSKFSGGAGLVALGAGVASLGLAIPGILGGLAIGSGIKKLRDQYMKNPFNAYKLSHKDVIAAVLKTNITDMNEGLGLFVKALKGMKVIDQIEKAKTQMVSIQNSMNSVNVDDMIKPYLDRMKDKDNKKKWHIVNSKHPANFKTLFNTFMNTKDQAQLTFYTNIGLEPASEVFAEARFISDYEEMLHENSLMDNLFEIDHTIPDIHLL